VKNDTFTVEILEDGTMKIETDPISPANHANAEQFIQAVNRDLGGATERKGKGKHAHTHSHHHHHHEHKH
jgi:hypothetical protein